MPKIRARPKNNEERCAVCRDGPEGLVVCRGCSTLLHAACLIECRGCPTIGCDEADPLQKPKPPAEVGAKIAKAKATRLEPERSPQLMVPRCLHDFSPENNRCVHCDLSLGVFAAKEFGSHWTGPSTVAEGERRHRVAKAAKEERQRQNKKHWVDLLIEYGEKLLGAIFVAIFLLLWLLGEFGGVFIR